jgi:hypothetical protein
MRFWQKAICIASKKCKKCKYFVFIVLFMVFPCPRIGVLAECDPHCKQKLQKMNCFSDPSQPDLNPVISNPSRNSLIDSPLQIQIRPRRPRRACNERSLGSDLAENGAQLVEVHRFGEMEIEASFLPAPDVFVPVKSSKGYSFNGLFSFRLRDHVVAAPVGQANVAQDDVELLRLDNLQRAPHAIGDQNLVTEMAEETGQDLERFPVILDNQNTQAFTRLGQCFCWIVTHYEPAARKIASGFSIRPLLILTHQ